MMRQTVSVSKRLATILLMCAGLGVVSGPPASAQSVAQSVTQAAVQPPQAEDVLSQARRLATSGQRPQAVLVLEERLKTRPDDVDARTLLGIIHSWDGRYPEARIELHRVLETNPGYYDAVAALANVELWDSHPDMALSLASSVLRRNPKDTGLMLTKARAESALGRVREARDTLDGLLAAEPANVQAKDFRNRLVDNERHWAAGYGYGADWFSDKRTSWREQWVVLKRQAGFGSVSLTASQADRYGLRDRQFEIEVYPRLRAGTYMYIDAGLSQDVTLYPKYRAGAHLYQSLGGGFEASIGMSRLGFGSGINIYIASLSKYLGQWLLIGQVFVTPHDFGTNASYHAAIRRYFSDKDYVGIRYHHGAAKEEIRTINDVQVLNADGLSGELVVLIARRLGLTVRGAYENQQRFGLTPLKQYSATATLNVRF